MKSDLIKNMSITLVSFEGGVRKETPWETLTEDEKDAFRAKNTDRFMAAMGYIKEEEYEKQMRA